ncbi:hypothetical protein SAMN05192534_11413 [Alteribacillus persepolensis]|uniref:Uncharacterized protein n=1 Tax=Alteribacillus persepolensis TaxID=568899 RepID=A0A1G8G2J8_9BACI|nr:hypothetical protein SAMN05192534_11413 [Alteribacillus persepolensis]
MESRFLLRNLKQAGAGAEHGERLTFYTLLTYLEKLGLSLSLHGNSCRFTYTLTFMTELNTSKTYVR